MDSSATRETTTSVTAYVQLRQQAHKTRDKTGTQTGNHNCKKVSNISRLQLTRGEAKKKRKRELLGSRVRLRLALHRMGIRWHRKSWQGKNEFWKMYQLNLPGRYTVSSRKASRIFCMVRTTLETLRATCIGPPSLISALEKLTSETKYSSVHKSKTVTLRTSWSPEQLRWCAPWDKKSSLLKYITWRGDTRLCPQAIVLHNHLDHV